MLRGSALSALSLIFGGGKFGCVAARYLLNRSEPFIVIDEKEECLAAKTLPLKKIIPSEVSSINLSEKYFLKGNVKIALSLIERLKPKYVFPTAPIHLAASLVAEKYGMLEWKEATEFLALRIPSSIVISIGRATIVVSYNKDAVCQPECIAPKVCPVTGLRKAHPIYALLKVAVPEGIILRSYQLKPGLGAISGDELLNALKVCGQSDRVIIGTACECHGVVTALKDPSRFTVGNPFL